MSVTKADVLRIAPEFSAVSEDDFAFFIAQAELFTRGTAWGDKRDLGTANLAAHFLTTYRPALASGVKVTSESVGAVSRSYNVATALDDLEETSYGGAFKWIRQSLPRSPFVL